MIYSKIHSKIYSKIYSILFYDLHLLKLQELLSLLLGPAKFVDHLEGGVQVQASQAVSEVEQVHAGLTLEVVDVKGELSACSKTIYLDLNLILISTYFNFLFLLNRLKFLFCFLIVNVTKKVAGNSTKAFSKSKLLKNCKVA